REDAGVEPVAARRRSVGLELAEAVDLLSGRFQHLGLVLRVRDVGEGLAVDLLQDLAEARLEGVWVAPGEIGDRLRQGAALLLVEVADGQEDPGDALLVGLRLSGGVEGLPLPLDPPGRVRERAVLLGEVRRGKEVDLRRDLGRIGRIVVLWRLPEDRRL